MIVSDERSFVEIKSCHSLKVSGTIGTEKENPGYSFERYLDEKTTGEDVDDFDFAGHRFWDTPLVKKLPLVQQATVYELDVGLDNDETVLLQTLRQVNVHF